MNQVFVTGHVGKDPRYKTTDSGFNCLTFSLGINDGYKDKEGVWQDKTTWINCKVFGKTAEKHREIMKKGTSVFVCGSIESGSYHKDGGKIYYTNILVTKLGLFKKFKPNEENKIESVF